MSMVGEDMVKLFINNSNSLNSNLVVFIRDSNFVIVPIDSVFLNIQET